VEGKIIQGDGKVSFVKYFFCRIHVDGAVVDGIGSSDDDEGRGIIIEAFEYLLAPGPDPIAEFSECLPGNLEGCGDLLRVSSKLFSQVLEDPLHMFITPFKKEGWSQEPGSPFLL